MKQWSASGEGGGSGSYTPGGSREDESEEGGGGSGAAGSPHAQGKEGRCRHGAELLGALYLLGLASFFVPPAFGRMMRLWVYGGLALKVVEGVAGCGLAKQAPPPPLPPRAPRVGFGRRSRCSRQ